MQIKSINIVFIEYSIAKWVDYELNYYIFNIQQNGLFSQSITKESNFSTSWDLTSDFIDFVDLDKSPAQKVQNINY